MITIIDVLRILEKGDNYLVKVNDYNKISIETVDEFNLFEKSENVPTKFKVIGHDSRTNIMVYQKVEGYVKLNPKQADRVGLPHKIKVNPTIKNRVIIRDGKVNSGNMDLIVDINTCLKLTQLNIDFKRIENKTNISGIAINLDITNLPIADDKLHDLGFDNILNTCKEINILKVKQKVLNALLGELKITSNGISGFTKEQTELLYDHGLNSSLQYVGVNNKQKPVKEQYTGKTISFKVSGSSSSSFKTLMERVKEGKKLNGLDTIQYNYYEELENKFKLLGLTDVEKIFVLNEHLDTIKNQIKELRLQNTISRILLSETVISEMAFDTSVPYKHKELTIEVKEEVFEK